jgi:hypothetical protein
MIYEFESKVKGRVCSSLESSEAALGFEQRLPFAAPALNISADPKDYVLSVIPIMYADLPNRNGVGFPISELKKWNVEHGCQAFESWRGAPMHVEHAADDCKTAIGIIVDVRLRPIKTHGNGQIWKVVALGAIDTTKCLGDEPDGIPIGQKVAKGEANTYSMGAMVDGYTCSYCGKDVGQCSHIDPKAPLVFYELNGKLVYKLVYGITGVELSVVADPAFVTAISDVRMTY